MTSSTIDRRYGVGGGAAIKMPARCATAANIVLAGLQTIDGVTLTIRDRVLVRSQTDAAENGIYSAAPGDWARVTDFNGPYDVAGGTLVLVSEGSAYEGSYWRIDGSGPISVGTDDITFIRALVDDSETLRFIQAGTGAVERSVQGKLRETEVSVFDYMTDAEIASVQAYGFATDVTTAINNAVDYAYRNALRLKFPPGGYSVTQIVLPDDPTVDPRFHGFEMVGAGRGEAFAVAAPRGTVIRGASATLSTLKFQQRAANEGSGVLLIHGFRFEGTQNSGIPVVDLEALYGASRLYDCDMYQNSAGDGLSIGLMATGSVDHCYILNGSLIGGNPSWAVSGVQSRTGIGLKLTGDINCGLATFSKVTCRGWGLGYDMGDPAGSITLFSTRMVACEVSVCTNGLRIRSRQRTMVVDSCYFEGVYGGTVILNEGDHTTITGCDIGAVVAADTWLIGIDDSSQTNIGTVITNNSIQSAAQSASVLIKVGSNAAYGGAGKLVKGNTLTWSGSGASYAGIVGIQIAGLNPRVEFSGNAFSPRGPWVGGAGTIKVDDQSTTGLGGSGQRALVGFGVVSNGNQEFPMMNQGAISLGIPEAALADADLSGGVLTTGAGSLFELTLTSTGSIDSVAKTQQGSVIFISATNNKPTFVHGANLKLLNGANYTPPASGAMLGFISYYSASAKPVLREFARTAYST